MKKHNDKKVILLGILGFLLIIGIVIGYSTAYFVASVVNKTPSQEALITTGSMELEFTDGSQVSLENTIPGSYIIKTFSVKNVGSVNAYYDIYLSDLINTFEDKSDLVYSLTSNEGGASVSETVIPSESTKIVSNQLINVNKTHYYTLRIDFKETNDNQDDNIGKTFSSVIRINEVKDAPKPYEIISGDLSTVGSVVKIGTEEFYVIGQEDDTHVKLLSKWNLNVGENAIGEATNLQDENMRSGVPFSSNNYWSEVENMQQEHMFPASRYTNRKENGVYVASIAQYVENYVTYLKNQNVNVTGRLLDVFDLRDIGCTYNEGETYACNKTLGGGAEEWVYETSYWTGFGGRDNSIMYMHGYGYIMDDNFSNIHGVRPVIILEK